MKKFLLSVGLVLACSGSTFAQKSKNHNFEISKNLEIFNDIYKQLDRFYVDTLNADTVIGWAIDAMLQRVDPFTVYYSEDKMDELKQMTTGKYAGMGALIRYNKKLDRVVIMEPAEGSPSQLVGIKAGDIILSIDDKDMKGVSVDKVSRMLRGDSGTGFVLKVQRYGEVKPLSFKIVRQNIQTPAVPYYGMIREQVGYICLSGFTENCARDVRRAVIDLKQKGARSLVLDLRGNLGGLLAEASEIVNLFVPRGQKLIYTKGKMSSNNTEYWAQKEPLDLKIPLVVLVDGRTASSAEVVAGALQDLDRAVIIGARTYGKGLVQVPREVPYNGSLKVTTGRYYIPSGRCIQAYDYRHLNSDGSVGVVPDSLTKVFKTASGREVRDGGGINPDITVKPDSLPTMVYELAESDALFDWVTQFVTEHKTIASAADFELTDEQYADFVKTIEKSDFSYNGRSEQLFKMLQTVARREGYYEEAEAEFNALFSKFQRHLGDDLKKFKKQIMPFLCDEIIRRYYYQKGAIIRQLKEDTGLDKALDVINDNAEYMKVLNQKK